MPATKFVPEVPHAQLQFENLKVKEAEILPGDGYDQYVKPFRTVEDIHVQAAVLSYLMREGQRLSWPQHWLERLSALLAALGKLVRHAGRACGDAHRARRRAGDRRRPDRRNGGVLAKRRRPIRRRCAGSATGNC